MHVLDKTLDTGLDTVSDMTVLMMTVSIYKSKKRDDLYVYLPKGADPLRLPPALLTGFGELVFVFDVQLSPARKLARVPVKTVMKAVVTEGYFVQMPPGKYMPGLPDVQGLNAGGATSCC